MHCDKMTREWIEVGDGRSIKRESKKERERNTELLLSGLFVAQRML